MKIQVCLLSEVSAFFSYELHLSGLLKDGTKVLRDLHVTNGCKMMVVGSTINDVLKVTPPAASQLKEEKAANGVYNIVM